MTSKLLTTTAQGLQQIIDMLLLNGTLTTCPGLVHGKIGISIFFFHYAQYTGNMLFANYAIDLIGEIQKQIHANSPADYEKGISGIGVGIDYLIRNKFLSAEDDILEDFDQRMVRAVMYDPWQDFSLYDGLTGYGKYWMMRLSYPRASVQARKYLLHIVGLIEEKIADMSADEQTDVYCFLHDLCQIQDFEICTDLLGKTEIPPADFLRLADSTIGNIIRIVQRNRYFNESLQEDVDIALKQIPDLNMEKPHADMGLLSGFAGEGMLRLSAIFPTITSWMLLL